MKTMPWFVYILLCDKKTYYVGLTGNPTQRLKSHKAKLNIATKEFSDIHMVYAEKHRTRKEAERREKQLKGWSRAKKKALTEGNLSLLVHLSKTQSLKKD
jgi:putative endonuclease